MSNSRGVDKIISFEAGPVRSNSLIVSGWGIVDEVVLTRSLQERFPGIVVSSFSASAIGTGQMADSLRVQMQHTGNTLAPNTLIAKIPKVNEASRAASRITRCYEVETSFYSKIRSVVDARVPDCYHVEYSAHDDEFLLLLEDLAPGKQGDQLGGCSVDDAMLAVTEMAKLHGSLWRSPLIEENQWLLRNSSDLGKGTLQLLQGVYPAFCKRYEGQLDSEMVKVGQKLVNEFPAYIGAQPESNTIVHRDFRLDNLLFGNWGGSRGVAILDWQTASEGVAISDLSYFVGSALLPEVRVGHEREVVDHYVSVINTYGVGISKEEAWRQYRLFSFGGFVMAIIASMLVEQTERGDEMFMAMANRHGQQILQLEALSFLS
jgi:aminoglycoside/choline kinase family phosphotransferase